MWILGLKGLKGISSIDSKVFKKLQNEWYYVNELLRRFHLIGRIPPIDSKVTIAY